MQLSPSLPLLSLAVLLAGCGTIMNGSYQKIGVSSNPTGASVTIDGIDVGKTPVILELKRNDDHMIRLTLDGYAPFDMPIKCKVSGWVWGNIVFGGLLGLAVDAITGGMYKLTPEDIHAQMMASGPGLVPGDDGIYITVVLSPNPDWQRIGYLQPAAAGR